MKHYLTTKKLNKTEMFIEKARKIHGDLYDYSKVEYTTIKNKILIIDPEYGEFLQTAETHLKGRGNPQRGLNIIKKKLTSCTKNFIEKARKIHGDLYDYSKVNYINSKTKVIIIDPIYGEFEQLPSKHLIGQGCKIRMSNSTVEKFIEKARKIHGDLYDYSKVNYINCRTKVLIIDPVYGEFEQTPEKHLLGQGNPQRGIIKRSENIKYDKNKFIELATKKYNGKYDYSKVKYIDCMTEITVIDYEYGEFTVKPFRHLSGTIHPDSYKLKTSIHKDHIIPFSLLCESSERNYYNKTPLGKIFNLDINIRYISKEENNKKSDYFYLFGEKLRGRDYRGDIEIIRYLFLREHNLKIKGLKNK